MLESAERLHRRCHVTEMWAFDFGLEGREKVLGSNESNCFLQIQQISVKLKYHVMEETDKDPRGCATCPTLRRQNRGLGTLAKAEVWAPCVRVRATVGSSWERLVLWVGGDPASFCL